MQLKTQMEGCWENHEDDQATAANGLRLAEGRCLFVGIKLVEQPFRKAAKPTHTLQGVDDGGFPAIDVVSCGFIRDNRVLSPRLKAYIRKNRPSCPSLNLCSVALEEEKKHVKCMLLAPTSTKTSPPL